MRQSSPARDETRYEGVGSTGQGAGMSGVERREHLGRTRPESYSNSHPTCELGDVWLQLSGVALSLSEDGAGFVGLYVECHKAENGDECAGSRCYATKQPIWCDTPWETCGCSCGLARGGEMPPRADSGLIRTATRLASWETCGCS